MNLNKNCVQEIRQVKVPQLALPPSGPRPTAATSHEKSTYRRMQCISVKLLLCLTTIDLFNRTWPLITSFEIELVTSEPRGIWSN